MRHIGPNVPRSIALLASFMTFGALTLVTGGCASTLLGFAHGGFVGPPGYTPSFDTSGKTTVIEASVFGGNIATAQTKEVAIAGDGTWQATLANKYQTPLIPSVLASGSIAPATVTQLVRMASQAPGSGATPFLSLPTVSGPAPPGDVGGTNLTLMLSDGTHSVTTSAGSASWPMAFTQLYTAIATATLDPATLSR